MAKIKKIRIYTSNTWEEFNLGGNDLELNLENGQDKGSLQTKLFKYNLEGEIITAVASANAPGSMAGGENVVNDALMAFGWGKNIIIGPVARRSVSIGNTIENYGNSAAVFGQNLINHGHAGVLSGNGNTVLPKGENVTLIDREFIIINDPRDFLIAGNGNIIGAEQIISAGKENAIFAPGIILNGYLNKVFPEARYSIINGQENILRSIKNNETGLYEIGYGAVLLVGSKNDISAVHSSILGYGHKVDNAVYVLLSGSSNETKANYTNLFGDHLKALFPYQTFFGYYNDTSDENILFGIGAGTMSVPKNIFSITKKGYAYIAGGADIVGTTYAGGLTLDNYVIKRGNLSSFTFGNNEITVKGILKATDGNDYIKANDYSTSNKAGVVRPDTTYGTYVNPQTGILSLVSATTSVIDEKKDNYRPIVPKTLDYAVKQGLVKNSEVWTEEEKAKARNLLGITPSSETIEVDTSLTQEGKAADAKAVGDKIFELNKKIDNTISNINSVLETILGV